MRLLDNQEPCERYYESCCFPSMQEVPQSPAVAQSTFRPRHFKRQFVLRQFSNVWRRLKKKSGLCFGKKTTIYSRTLICKTHRSRFWIDHVTLSHMVLTRERSTEKVYTYIPIVRHKAAEDVSLMDRQVFQVSSLSVSFLPFLYPSIYVSSCLSIDPSSYLSFELSSYLAVYLSLSLSNYLTI